MRRAGNQAESWNADRARQELELWQGSGETMEAFSSKRGYRANRLSWWKRELRLKGQWTPKEAAERTGKRTQETAGTILEATVVGAASNWTVVVEMGMGVRIKVANPAAVEPRWIATVAANLARGG